MDSHPAHPHGAAGTVHGLLHIALSMRGQTPYTPTRCRADGLGTSALHMLWYADLPRAQVELGKRNLLHKTLMSLVEPQAGPQHALVVQHKRQRTPCKPIWCRMRTTCAPHSVARTTGRGFTLTAVVLRGRALHTLVVLHGS